MRCVPNAHRLHLDRRVLVGFLLALLATTAPASMAQTDSSVTVSIDTPTEGATVNGTVDIAGTALASNGSVDRVEVRIDGGTWVNATGTSSWSHAWDSTSYADGDHTIEARAWSGNNSSAPDVVNVTVDNDPPTVTIESPTEGATVSGTVDVSGSASDTGDAIERVEVRVGGGSWNTASGTSSWSWSFDSTQVSDGQHTLEARASDGNATSTLDAVNVTVDNTQDTNDRPSVSIQSPSAGETVSGIVEVTGAASDPDGTVELVEVRVDGNSWMEASGTSSWSWSFDSTQVSDGTHSIEARASDGTDTSPIVERTIDVQNDAGDDTSSSDQPPQIVIDRPSQGATVSGTVNIEGRSWDPDGHVTLVRVQIDDGPWRQVSTGAWSLEWNATGATNGSHMITAHVQDDDGIDNIDRITVEVDNSSIGDQGTSTNELPKLTVHTPEDGETVQGEVLIAGTASDPDGELARLELRIDDWGWMDGNLSNSWVHRWDMSEVPEGTHLLTVRITDAQGASDIVMRRIHVLPPSQEGLETASVDDGNATGSENATTAPLDPPTVRLDEPTDGSEIGEELHLQGTATDPDGTGTLTIRYRIDDGSWESFEVSSGEAFAQNVDTSDLSPGEHTLTLEAEGDGGTSETQATTFTVEPAQGPHLGLAVLVIMVLAGGGLILWARSHEASS